MMLEEMRFTVIVIDGDFRTFDQLDQDCLHYDSLTWDEACELVRISFMQGFQTVLWQACEEEC